MILKPKTAKEWLQMRGEVGIGGSDAGAVIGLNKYKTNVQLWKEKTGLEKPADVSNAPAVRFGKKAEEHIRELFRLEHPEYEIDYHEFWMYQNDEHPYMFATLDGEITTEDGQKGILEIKTATIMNSNQWYEWNDKIPDTYYAQILHQLAATGWDFAILKAYIRHYKGDELRVTIRHYRVDRKDVESDIEYLIEEEKKFIQCVREKKCPAQKLPMI